MCGVYYTIDKSTDDIYSEIHNITGGRMADFLIFDTGDSQAFSFTGYVHRGGTLCIRDEYGSEETMSLNIRDICHKELNVTGVYNGAKYFSAAINLLAMRVIELISPEELYSSFENAPELIEKYSERRDDPVKAIFTF